MTVANCYSWCCAEGLKYWSKNNSKHKEWNKKWHSNASDSRQPPAFSSFSLSSIIRPWRCRSWRPWLKDLRRSHSEMTRDEAKMSDELPWHFLFWATEVTKTCLWPQLVTSMYIYIYIYILKNKMKPTNPNAHTYVNGTDVKTHGYAVTHNTFLQ